MSENRYDIILTGNSLTPSTQSALVQAFAKLFKKSEQQAKALFQKAPTVIKESADTTTTKKYVAALKQANIEVKIRPSKNSSPSESTALAAVQSSPPNDTDQHSEVVHSTETPWQQSPSGVSFNYEGQPDYAFLTVKLDANASLKVEASSMASMDTHIKMRTKMKGGFGRLLTGESLFINDFTAENAPGEIGIAPALPGDIVHRYLSEGETLFLRNSAYLASSPTLQVETKLDIFKGIFSGAGLILIKCIGDGDLWFNTYGAAIEIEVDGEYIVDTDKIIAWTEGLEYKISSVGGYKSLFFSGEGFVCRFSGKGTLWVQTRSAKAFTSWAHFFRPAN